MTITATLASGYDASISATPASGYNASISAVELTDAEQWATVAEPDAAFSWLPFTVEKNIIDSRFRVSRDFDIQTQAGITVTKTYYLNTETGDDSNSGLTAALPKKTWNHIMGLADYDRVIIQDGSELFRSSSSLQPARNVEVIGEGSVKWTSRHNVGAWSLVGGRTYTYSAAVSPAGEYIAWVYDFDTLNAYGLPTRYTAAADVAAVEATAGSFLWVAGGTLNVHALNGADPTGQNIKYYDSTAAAWYKNTVRYFENVTFEGGFSMRNASSAGGAKVYLNGCTFRGMGAWGLDEFIALDCVSHSAPSDTINYDVSNTLIIRAVEINCDFGRGGTDTTNQASTAHNACIVVRINGDYRDVTGQCVADVGASQIWMVSCDLERGTDGVYLGGTGGKAWLDTCTISDCSGNGINVEAGATVYTRSLTNTEGTTGAGTITTY